MKRCFTSAGFGSAAESEGAEAKEEEEKEMARPLNMNAMAYFEAVARHSRVNLAAGELLVSPSAVSQQIKLLEERMGVSLFRRIKRRLILTEEGERLYQSATQALRLLRDAQERVSRTREHRSIVIRVATSFGVLWLGPRISDFVSDSPGVDLHIDATSELTDFERESVDLEIRYGAEPIRGLHCHPLIVDRVLPLCSPRLAATARQAGISETLSTARLIHTVKAAVRWRYWLDRHEMAAVDDAHGLRFDRSSMAIQAAADGLGVILETATLAMNELRTGRLVPLAPDLGCLAFPAYWLTCPARHLNRRTVRRFAQWIEARAEAHEGDKNRLLESLGVTASRPYPD